jgi:HPt (histidine-containing phosphotransfer) domain-containing protein
MFDDAELAGSVITRFRQSVPDLIASLRDALNAGDAVTAQRHAHSIRGAASNVGGEQLRIVAGDMENAASSGDLGSAARHLTALQEKFESLNSAILASELGRLNLGEETVGDSPQSR